ncbi:MAG: AraC family transcriptional regulator [Actinomycetota bacterium]|jgi:methylphosphotriester-DNA--protein-cysteine methyltransferase|nr:AraC family transcriptional regulator [Actinomycetota bacterium]
MADIDFDKAYQAVLDRDDSLDGTIYTGVLTTGIYCKPSCSARTPFAKNVRFFDSPAAAEESGLRACKRCRPNVAVTTL